MNHRDHLALTFSFLQRYGFTHGSDAVFEHLRALDAAENGRRFHATLSTVWPRLLAAHIAAGDDEFDAFIRREYKLNDKGLPLQFYTEERLFSDVAKGRFVEPDIRDLPRIRIAPDGLDRTDSPRRTRYRDARR